MKPLGDHVDVIEFELILPAHLPFNLLAWAQVFTQNYNCKALMRILNIEGIGSTEYKSPHYQRGTRRLAASKPRPPKAEKWPLSNPNQTQSPFYFLTKAVMELPESIRSAYSICPVNFGRHHYGKQHYRVVYHKQSLMHNLLHIDTLSPGWPNSFRPIQYIYYSECDQIVRFDNHDTLRAVSSASTNVTFITGRRREKRYDSDPAAYMGSLSAGRYCGEKGYSLHWPYTSVVYNQPSP